MKRTPLKRTSSLTRTAIARSRRRINPTNPARRKREFARSYGSAERAAWVRQQACVVCHAVPSENAHIIGGGAGRKADADQIAPLCHRHHVADDHSFHHLGSARAFGAYWNVDLSHAAAVTEQRWQAHNETNP